MGNNCCYGERNKNRKIDISTMISRDEHLPLSRNSQDSSSSAALEDLNHMAESQRTTKNIRSNNDSLFAELPSGITLSAVNSLFEKYSEVVLFGEEKVLAAFWDFENDGYLLISNEGIYQVSKDFSTHQRWPLCHIITFFIVPSKSPSNKTQISFLVYNTVYSVGNKNGCAMECCSWLGGDLSIFQYESA